MHSTRPLDSVDGATRVRQSSCAGPHSFLLPPSFLVRFTGHSGVSVAIVAASLPLPLTLCDCLPSTENTSRRFPPMRPNVLWRGFGTPCPPLQFFVFFVPAYDAEVLRSGSSFSTCPRSFFVPPSHCLCGSCIRRLGHAFNAAFVSFRFSSSFISSSFFLGEPDRTSCETILAPCRNVFVNRRSVAYIVRDTVLCSSGLFLFPLPPRSFRLTVMAVILHPRGTGLHAGNLGTLCWDGSHFSACPIFSPASGWFGCWFVASTPLELVIFSDAPFHFPGVPLDAICGAPARSPSQLFFSPFLCLIFGAAACPPPDCYCYPLQSLSFFPLAFSTLLYHCSESFLQEKRLVPCLDCLSPPVWSIFSFPLLPNARLVFYGCSLRFVLSILSYSGPVFSLSLTGFTAHVAPCV